MPVLEQQLEIVAPELVVPLGRHALAHFAPAAKIGEVHGRRIEAGGRALYPLYHPAAALRSTKLRETLLADARGLTRV
jgi:DNA polymerase